MKIKTLEVPSYFSFLKLQKIPAHKLSYTEWGDVMNPSKVLCLHAISRNSRDFDKLASSLSNSHHVICPDFPGRGKSSWFQNAKYYNYHTYIKDIIILLKSLKISQVTIIGTSMGGIIGMALAAFHPKYIKSLILNDIGPHIPVSTLTKIGKHLKEPPSFPNFEECKIHIKKLLKGFGIEEEEDWDHFTKHSFRLDETQKYYFHFDPKIFFNFHKDSNIKSQKDVDLWYIWHRIKCPILLIWGIKSDILVKETVREMFKKNIDLYQVENAGHAPALVNIQDIQVITNWLK